MDYLIDRIPIDFSQETRATLKNIGYNVVMFADWVCGANDIRWLLADHPTVLLCSLTFFATFLLTFIHAVRMGGRHVYMWIGTVVFGMMYEIRKIHLCETNDFMCLKLTMMCQSLLVALTSTALRVPFVLIGTKMLWWTWHTEHPFLVERLGPLRLGPELIYSLSVMYFVLFFRIFHRCLLTEDYNWKLFIRELICVLTPAQLAPVFGFYTFEVIFLMFKQLAGNLCSYFFIFLLFSLISNYEWIQQLEEGRRQSGYTVGLSTFFAMLNELTAVIFIMYTFLLIVLAFYSPEDVISTGIHQPLGSCRATTTKHSFLDLSIEYKDMLCLSKLDPNFDFHCVKKKPEAPSGGTLEWYTVCGRPISDKTEMWIIISAWMVGALLSHFRWTMESDALQFAEENRNQQ
ncbi:hypothetical protein D917_04392 [Trichinella nativa]|uniref:DUF7802 domain-containing protein n=1 Tax=Trichinella nativa TaxID=6335 RepID=A0A1Y3E4Y3_9BILA|nr:hypothetical protein D917_04392 [Trichinella nativa]